MKAVMRRWCTAWAMLAAGAMVVACGGGGGGAGSATSGNPGGATPSMQGTAAVGAPLSGAQVVVQDATGRSLSVTAGATGAYVFPDLGGLTPPLMLQATGKAGGLEYQLHSVYAGGIPSDTVLTLNTTPATEAIAAQALGAHPSAAFAQATNVAALTPEKVAQAKARINAALKDVFAALSLASTVDLASTPFAADSTGLDRLLDAVDFRTEVQGGAATTTVTNKSDGRGVTVASTAAPQDVAPVPVLSLAALRSDVSGIRTLVGKLNTLAATEALIASPAMLELFDPDYLDDGLDRQGGRADFTGFAGFRIDGYVLQGCDATGTICRINYAFTEADGLTGFDQEVVKLGADGTWRLYGNRRSFEYDFNPVAAAAYAVDRGNVARASLTPGANLNIDAGTAGSARLEWSFDGGSTWEEAVTLVRSNSCGVNYLVRSETSCGNFFAIPGGTAAAANEARLDGDFRIRVTTFANTDFTGASQAHSEIGPVLLTAAGAERAVEVSRVPVRSGYGLGGNAVTFTGLGIEFIRVEVLTPDAMAPISRTVEWRDNTIAPLAGEISLQEARAQCGSSTQCATGFGINAHFNQLFVVARTMDNQSVWASFYLPMTPRF